MTNRMALSDGVELAHLPVRERILVAAADLFYRYGIKAVGIDVIVELAGIAKTSLYRHFPSKDDLIAAYLRRQDEIFWQSWGELAQANIGLSARDRLLCALSALAQTMDDQAYRGCSFLNAAAELPDPGHQGMDVVRMHKRKLRDRLRMIAATGDFEDPDALADAMALLIDGAIGNRLVHGNDGPSRALLVTGKMLVDASPTRSKTDERVEADGHS